MSNDKVTLKDVYEAVNRLEDKMDARFRAIEMDVESNKSFKNRALGIFSITSVMASAVWAYLFNRLVGR